MWGEGEKRWEVERSGAVVVVVLVVAVAATAVAAAVIVGTAVSVLFSCFSVVVLSPVALSPLLCSLAASVASLQPSSTPVAACSTRSRARAVKSWSSRGTRGL